MKWPEYLSKFDEVLKGKNTEYPYDNPEYVEFVKLNNSRMNRWLKKAALTDETARVLDMVNCRQKWILIAEPWCADAANIAPIIDLMAEYSGKIDFEIDLRDGESHLIDSYLTNGGKASPKLIARDEFGKDVFVWGPRPAACQALVTRNKDADMTPLEKKMAIQVWYNEDEGVAIQQEIRGLLEASCNQTAFP